MAIVGKFWNATLTVNSVVLTTRVRSAVLTIGKEIFDLTVFGQAGRVRAASGLEDHSLAVEFIEDLAASGAGAVQATLLGIWTAGTPVPIKFRMDSGALSTTNPEFDFDAVLGTLPIGGQQGGLFVTSVTFLSSGVLTVDTTP